jgi:hypothetical protein
MNKEFLKMQKTAGLITESQYKIKLDENLQATIKTLQTDKNFNQLVAYLKQNPDQAKELEQKEDKIIQAIENDSKEINERAYKDKGKYYSEDAYGKSKEITFKEYLKAKALDIGLPAGAMALLGALMAGPLGVNDPQGILDAVLVASGIGAVAGAGLSAGKGKSI